MIGVDAWLVSGRLRPDFRETVDTGLAGIYRERYRRQSKRFDTNLIHRSSKRGLRNAGLLAYIPSGLIRRS